MANLVIHLDLLTERYVAADVSRREKPEWPPHPGRIFMAMAATCFEIGEAPDDVAALKWLEKLDPPSIYCGVPQARTTAKTYVPVNDKPTGGGILQTAPGMSRSRQERTFPSVAPEAPTVRLCWSIDDPKSVPINSLDRLCAELIRVGHSSSLVRAAAYLTDDEVRMNDGENVWKPVNGGADSSLRVMAEGTLDDLVVDAKREQIEVFATLAESIETSKGKAKEVLKEQFAQVFGIPYKHSLRPPEPTPATIRAWSGYRVSASPDDQQASERVHVPRDMSDELIVLAKHEGLSFTLSDTLMLVKQLRSAMMSACNTQPAPEWLSGHDGQNVATKLPHVALVPLAYVGTRYADGHLMGMAIVPPRRISAAEFGREIGPLVYREDGELTEVILRLRRSDDWKLRIENRDEPAMMLRARTWTKPSRVWASVTPVVLDRFPKKDRRNDPVGWRAEVAKTILRSCEFSGIATPTAIDIDTTAFVTGVPRSTQKRLKKQGGNHGIGDGFPPYTTAPGKPPRPQVHVRLTFDRPHAGPVLLGAGRFMGYGMFKPVSSKGARDE